VIGLTQSFAPRNLEYASHCHEVGVITQGDVHLHEIAAVLLGHLNAREDIIMEDVLIFEYI
jgi:hypothetical protein